MRAQLRGPGRGYTYWAIRTPIGDWLPASLHIAKSWAIRRAVFVNSNIARTDFPAIAREWRTMRRAGYRCVRVLITEL